METRNLTLVFPLNFSLAVRSNSQECNQWRIQGGDIPPTKLLASQSFEFILIIIILFHSIFSIMPLIYSHFTIGCCFSTAKNRKIDFVI